jgi:hypothetical protein
VPVTNSLVAILRKRVKRLARLPVAGSANEIQATGSTLVALSTVPDMLLFPCPGVEVGTGTYSNLALCCYEGAPLGGLPRYKKD